MTTIRQKTAAKRHKNTTKKTITKRGKRITKTHKMTTMRCKLLQTGLK